MRNFLVLAVIHVLVGEMVAGIDADGDDDELVTANGAALSMAIILGLSGGLLLLLYVLLKVRMFPYPIVKSPAAGEPFSGLMFRVEWC